MVVEAVSGTERSCAAGEGGSFEGRPVSVATSWASVGSHVDGWTGEGIFFLLETLSALRTRIGGSTNRTKVRRRAESPVAAAVERS